jgi:hypothetical protein
MIEILGIMYYIDFDTLDSFLISDKSLKAGEVEDVQTTETFDNKNKLVGKTVITTKTQKSREVNGVRFDVIRGFINDLGDDEEDDVDSKIGKVVNVEEMSIRFKLAFNTLVAYGILKQIED